MTTADPIRVRLNDLLAEAPPLTEHQRAVLVRILTRPRAARRRTTTRQDRAA